MQLMHMRKSAHAWKNFQNETRAISCFTTLFSRAGIQYALDRHNSKPNVGIERDGMKLDTLKTLYTNELRTFTMQRANCSKHCQRWRKLLRQMS